MFVEEIKKQLCSRVYAIITPRGDMCMLTHTNPSRYSLNPPSANARLTVHLEPVSDLMICHPIAG